MTSTNIDKDKAKAAFLALKSKRLSHRAIVKMAADMGYDLGSASSENMSQYAKRISEGDEYSYGSRISNRGEYRLNLLRFLTALDIEPNEPAHLVAKLGTPVIQKRATESFSDFIFARMVQELRDYNAKKDAELRTIIEGWLQNVRCNLVEEALIQNGYSPDHIRTLCTQAIDQSRREKDSKE